MVIVPSGFTADFLAGSPNATITMIQDPTLTVTPLVVRSMLTSLLDGISGGGIAYQTISDRQQALGLGDDPAQVMSSAGPLPGLVRRFRARPVPQPGAGGADHARASRWTNPRAEVGIAGLMKFIMAGQMIFFAFFTGGYAMMSILQEQEEGHAGAPVHHAHQPHGRSWPANSWRWC